MDKIDKMNKLDKMYKMYNCHDNIFTSPKSLAPIASKYSLIKTITPGVSGSRVYLIKRGTRLYFCKITRIADKLTKTANLQKSIFQVFPEYRDILIGCQLSQLSSRCFPKIYHWGYTDYLDPWNETKPGQYIFIILEYLGKTNLKNILIKRMQSGYSKYFLVDFRKNMKQILDCYMMANKEIGFIHDDFKPDNIMIDNKKAVMIDFGLSYTTKYKKNPNLRVLLERFSYSLLPVTKRYYIEFDKLFTDKSLYYSKISHNYIDLEKIIRTINLGERILNGVEIKFSDEDYKYFNSKAPFHRKLNLIKMRYVKTITV